MSESERASPRTASPRPPPAPAGAEESRLAERPPRASRQPHLRAPVRVRQNLAHGVSRGWGSANTRRVRRNPADRYRVAMPASSQIICTASRATSSSDHGADSSLFFVVLNSPDLPKGLETSNVTRSPEKIWTVRTRRFLCILCRGTSGIYVENLFSGTSICSPLGNTGFPALIDLTTASSMSARACMGNRIMGPTVTRIPSAVLADRGMITTSSIKKMYTLIIEASSMEHVPQPRTLAPFDMYRMAQRFVPGRPLPQSGSTSSPFPAAAAFWAIATSVSMITTTLDGTNARNESNSRTRSGMSPTANAVSS